MKLLIVDKSEPIRTSLRRLLEGIQGIEAIHTADTLIKALACVRLESPSLVILDLRLPDGNAFSIVNTMKHLAPGVQIALLNNDASEYYSKKSMKAGADWIFDKAFEVEALCEVVRNQAAMSSRINKTGGQRQ